MTRSAWVPGAVLLLLATPGARAGTALPDLIPEIADRLIPTSIGRDTSVDPADVAEGCAGAATGRTLVNFGLLTHNEGAADLTLGDPGCPDCETDPGPTCENPLFECSPLKGHGHPHFTKYALYEILAERGADAVAAGHKESFCLEDTFCPTPTYTCYDQGLTVGCLDYYPQGVLGCQYVDVTDIPPGRYLLRVTINYEQLLPESNYDNNVDEKLVDVCEGIAGPRMRIKVSKKAPDVWRWKIKGSARVRQPLVARDAFKDGAHFRLEAGKTVLVATDLPGRPGSGHCGPKDGWKRNGTGAPYYVNESGFIDQDCTEPSGGLARLSVRTTSKARDGLVKMRYQARGVSPMPIPQRLRVTVGVGADTGGCWTGAVRCDGTRCEPSSAEGAFVD